MRTLLTSLLTSLLIAAPAVAEPLVGGRVLIADGDAAPRLDAGLRAGARIGRVDVGGELALGLSGQHHTFGGDVAPAIERVDLFITVGLMAVAGMAILDVGDVRWTLEAGAGPAQVIALDTDDDRTTALLVGGTHLVFPLGDLLGGRFSAGLGLEARSLGFARPTLGGGLHLAALVID